ncbi:hypothetical protein F3Y22_tig00112305pilonHSYRG00053 [Hibiscus syriacus]|uniref:Retrotransposon gag domain-containing protein n=1 Tax=Hibiscus syriacus TaxID=106335 RepID=A0A6A2X1D0_HIBSY|nr:hypothetical protein F3Y22_tig00112305pilonHSYRG00053 [Hibiscus syriacus]
MSLVANEDFQHILRVLNTNVDGKKKNMFAMTSIKGIGRRFANFVCKKADVDMSKSTCVEKGTLLSEKLLVLTKETHLQIIFLADCLVPSKLLLLEFFQVLVSEINLHTPICLFITTRRSLELSRFDFSTRATFINPPPLPYQLVSDLGRFLERNKQSCLFLHTKPSRYPNGASSQTIQRFRWFLNASKDIQENFSEFLDTGNPLKNVTQVDPAFSRFSGLVPVSLTLSALGLKSLHTSSFFAFSFSWSLTFVWPLRTFKFFLIAFASNQTPIRTVEDYLVKMDDNNNKTLTAILATLTRLTTQVERFDEIVRERQKPQLDLPNQNPRPNNVEFFVPRREQPRFQAPELFAKPKFTIPSFKGDNDPDRYIEWEGKVDLMFAYHDCPQAKQVHLITTQFEGYARTWWMQTRKKIQNFQIPTITSWTDLKQTMRKRFLPTLTRFIVGLNSNIIDLLDLQGYENLEDALKKAMTIEAQIQRKYRFSEHYQGKAKKERVEKEAKAKEVTSYKSQKNNDPWEDFQEVLGDPPNELPPERGKQHQTNLIQGDPPDGLPPESPNHYAISMKSHQLLESRGKAREVVIHTKHNSFKCITDRGKQNTVDDALPRRFYSPQISSREFLINKPHLGDLRDYFNKPVDMVFKHSFSPHTNKTMEKLSEAIIQKANSSRRHLEFQPKHQITRLVCKRGFQDYKKSVPTNKKPRLKRIKTHHIDPDSRSHLFEEREDDTCITRLTSKEEVITLPNDPLVQALEKKIRTTAYLRRLFEWDTDLIWSTWLLEIHPSFPYLSNGS